MVEIMDKPYQQPDYGPDYGGGRDKAAPDYGRDYGQVEPRNESTDETYHGQQRHDDEGKARPV